MPNPSPKLTRQQIFDTVYDHLRKQGGRSVNDIGKCLYRAPGGRSCAVGCLISDEEYSPRMEGTAVYGLADHDLLPLDLLPHLPLLRLLQTVHDNWISENLSDLRKAFKITADEFHLNHPTL